MGFLNGFCSVSGRSRRFSGGFTLIEFLVAMLLISIALGLAVPSLQRFTANNQVVSANNTIVTGLNMARSAAITTGNDITICPTVNGTSCAEDKWDSGWIIYNDLDSDDAPDAAEIVRVVTVESAVSNSGFGDSIVFQSDGTTELGSNATITNCYEFDEYSGTCMNVTISQFGLIESAKHDESESGDGPVDDPVEEGGTL